MAKPASSPAQGKGRKPSAPEAGAAAPTRAARASRADAEDALPDAGEIARRLDGVRSFMENPRHGRVRDFLRRLAEKPPQVLLLEGGTVEERLDAAHYWALMLNCEAGPSDARTALPGLLPANPGPHTAPSDGPCLECPVCVRMVTHLHRDCRFLDGYAASIKIDDVRQVRAMLGEPPREARFRVVILREAQALVDAAANALLKSLEEPVARTSFVLLAPQRERLLPTLVSRSLTLTLAWPDAASGPSAPDGAGVDAAAWEAALCRFLASGQGWFERTGAKGQADARVAETVTGLCRRALSARILARQTGAAPREGLETLFARMPVRRLRMLDEILAECQDSLSYGVSPVLVLEWLATRLYFLVPR